MNNPSAVILAAGTSSRMGEPNKLLLDLNGTALVRHVVMQVLRSEPMETIVVTGHQQKEVKSALAALDLTFVHNPAFAQGMTGSIQAGVDIARGDGFMICLGDMYALKASDYALLMKFFREKNRSDLNSICLPFYNGERGNPVIFSSAYREEILAHREPEGCREIIRENARHLYKFQADSAAFLKDLDTPDDYQALKNNLR